MSTRPAPKKAAPKKAKSEDAQHIKGRTPAQIAEDIDASEPDSLQIDSQDSDHAEAPGQDEGSTVDFDALAELADLAIMPGSTHPRDNATRPIDGDPYVRMLNLTGHSIAVSVRLVADRLMDGYKFIDGEPTVPIISTPVGEHPDIPKSRVARSTALPKTATESIRVWFGEMRKDLRTMRNRKNLDWDYMHKLGTILAQDQQSGTGNRL